MTVSARLATAADEPLVVAITHAAYAEYLPLLDREPLPMTEDYGPRIAAGGVYLVSEGGADVAAAVIERHEDHMMIFNLAVVPAGQGRGLGRWMLSFVEDLARAEGLGAVRLYTNSKMERNIRVYGKAGYVETGRLDNPARPGWIAVHMSKRLV